MKRQRGILLLPVALTLTVIGALAYTMTRDGAMSVSSIDADYETEAARYLAEGAVQLVKWQNEKTSCFSESGFGTLRLLAGASEIGTLESGIIDREGKNTLAISVSARTARSDGAAPAVHHIDERKVTVHDRFAAATLTLNGSGGNDTSLKRDVTTSLATQSEIELSDEKAHAVLRFTLPGELDGATVLSAQLKVVQSYTDSTQVGSLAVHRLTRDWGPGATWASPWSSPGGDYVAGATASVTVGPELKEYVVPIDGLAQGWASRTIDNQGILLKPSGLLNARFHSLDAATASSKPKLVLRYYPRC